MALAAGLALAGCTTADTGGGAPTASQASPADYAAVLTAASRPEADRTRDATRKPAELLALAEVSPGERVGDWIMGGGYFTRVLSAAVGPTGKVYAYQPAEFVSFRAQYGTDQDTVAAAHANVQPIRAPLTGLRFPEPLDAIVTIQNYHDLYLKPMPPAAAPATRAEMFRALKPGGVLLVVDHSAADGSGTRDADSLHRIDKQTVIQELTAVGFRLEAESDLFRLASDARTTNVFDPSIRGKTDQFVLKFRKPA
jgi:predicted methyltransferase